MPNFKIKNSKNKIYIIILTIIFTILLCLNIFFPFKAINAEKNACNLSSNSLTFYAIAYEKSLTQKGAEALAIDYQKANGSGYVIKKDDYYYVLNSCYLNKNDAVLVQNSLKTNFNTDTTIIEIKLPSINFSLTLNNEEKKTFQKALNSFENAYKLLFDVAVSLETLVYNEISARLAINSAFSSINTTFSDFKILFGEIEEENIKTLFSYLEKLTNTMQKLCSGILINKEQTFISLIKYRYTEIISLSIELSEKLI